ncbi:hypothetical protein GIB67_022987 [Kingdonia uniflora]|uniref:GATA-type domain-containing protein n=1 Tax=Kingdonia uniflora TaxID=39325 RepID=A0A7J7P382_9MAGN|nr:hypothetical protein GIB67_022987 [Kingdonia uniflora]
MDLRGKGSGSDVAKKTCSDCKTFKTPLWRSGPEGPKTLCNACGIKYRKRKRVVNVFSNNEIIKKERSKKIERRNNNMLKLKLVDNGSKEERNKKIEKRNSNMLKLRLLAFGREVLMKRSEMEKQRKLGEEEEAAVLLMALSCGSVYA